MTEFEKELVKELIKEFLKITKPEENSRIFDLIKIILKEDCDFQN